MSVLDVWNQALSAVNARGRLSSLVDRTPEQEVCNQWYSLVRDTIQTAAWWPACKTNARLALITEQADDEWFDGEPEPGYQFAYALPDNFLHPWHLSDYSRFSLSYTAVGNRVMISTNTVNPILVYARRNEATEQWSPGQLEATIQGLAAKIAGPLTGKTSMIDRHFQMARASVEAEQARTANIIEPDPRPAVPWLAARGYQSYTQQRYYYPYGSLTALTNAG